MALALLRCRARLLGRQRFELAEAEVDLLVERGELDEGAGLAVLLVCREEWGMGWGQNADSLYDEARVCVTS